MELEETRRKQSVEGAERRQWLTVEGRVFSEKKEKVAVIGGLWVMEGNFGEREGVEGRERGRKGHFGACGVWSAYFGSNLSQFTACLQGQALCKYVPVDPYPVYQKHQLD